MKPRLLILTDIGGDPDDQQSMIRLMCWSNKFDIEGLIASASGTIGELDKSITRPDLILEIVEAYAEVAENLRLHDSNFPDPEILLKVIKSGNPFRGIEFIGEEHDTPGSELIIKAVNNPDPRPLNICIWGGQTDLAQAMWRVRKNNGEAALANFISKIRIHDIEDQDFILSWMLKEFPNMFYVLSKSQDGIDRREGAYRGMYLGGNESLTSREWVTENVKTNHGPLGALYPMNTWTDPNPNSCLKEGDTPSWFYFLNNGLQDPAHPEWGGWGGRFALDESGAYRNQADKVGNDEAAKVAVWRWRPAFQAEFKARMDWCVKTPEECSHPPIAVLQGDKSTKILKISAKPGETVELCADGSADADGGKISCHWSIYPEAGTCNEKISIIADSTKAKISIPQNLQNSQIHVILEVVGDGPVPITSYRRAILEIQ